MPTKVFSEIFKNISKNIYNDSGMECSAIYQRPYTEACQLEINPHHASRNKEKKIFSKKFQCDKCDKKYTWYSGLANHKRFVHNKQKEQKEM